MQDIPPPPEAEQISNVRLSGRTMILDSVITCPCCAAAKSETMPANACQIFYTCKSCGAALRPKPGDCCVFCSHGSVPCPPIQAARSGEPGITPCCTD